MKVPPLLSRYISKNFFLSFLATLFVLMALILLFDTIELLRRSASKDYMTFADVLNLGLLKLPQMVPLILPFAILIASLVTFYRLSRSNELVIARSAGLSVWNFLMPVFLVVFLIGLFNVTLFNPFATIMQQKFETVEGIKFQKNNNVSWTSKGLWLREKKGEEPVIIHADSVRQVGTDLHLYDVSVLELTALESLKRQIEAPEGLLQNNMLKIAKGLSFNDLGEKKEEQNLIFPSDLSLEKIMQTFNEPESFSVWQLPGFIHMLDDAGFSSVRHRMYFYSVLSSVFYLLAMVFIAAVFSLSPNQRSGNTLMKMTGAVLCGLILFFLSRLTLAFGTSGALPVILAAFGPSIVVIFVAATALLHLEDG